MVRQLLNKKNPTELHNFYHQGTPSFSFISAAQSVHSSFPIIYLANITLRHCISCPVLLVSLKGRGCLKNAWYC